MDLFTYYRSTASYRVRIALALKGLEVHAVPVNLLRGVAEQRLPSYLALNPQGRVPALGLEGGHVLTQSSAIIEYLEERFPEPALLPAISAHHNDPQCLLARAKHREVAALIACDVHPLHNVSVLERLRAQGQGEDEVNAWIRHWITEGLSNVEALIGDTDFCFGKVGLADVYLLPLVYAARRFNVELRAFPRIRRVAALALQHKAFQTAHPDAQSDSPE